MGQAVYAGRLAYSWHALRVGERKQWHIICTAYRYNDMRTVPIPRDDFETFDGLGVAHNVIEHLWSVLLHPEQRSEAYTTSWLWSTYHGSSYGRLAAFPFAGAFPLSVDIVVADNFEYARLVINATRRALASIPISRHIFGVFTRKARIKHSIEI